jgi:alpha 1,2-mannosyltransferase
MNWLTLLLILFVAMMGILVVGLFVYMLSYKTSEVDQIAGEPPFGQLRLHSNNQEPMVSVPMDMSAYEQKLNNMSSQELHQELLRMISDENGSDESVTNNNSENVHVDDDDALNASSRNARALQLLDTVRNTTIQPVGVTVGEGRGIVICAGGFEYGTSAFVLLKLMREQGCILPVEIWHRNDEMSEEMKELFENLNADVRNIDQVASFTFQNRYAIKPLALYHSKFEQVLLIDADNVTVKDPTYLFDMLTLDQPAIFWPDYWTLDRNARCFKVLTEEQITKMTYAWTQESGQILVDKKYCMHALMLCVKINVQLYSQFARLFPEPFNHGDKDTWHFSWLSTSTNFHMIKQRAGGAGTRDGTGQYIGTTIVQYDEYSEPIFLHKCWAKWALQTAIPQWTDIMRFLNPSRGRVNQWTHVFEDGPIVREQFTEIFGGLEESCWEKLREIRDLSWYKLQFAKELIDIQ